MIAYHPYVRIIIYKLSILLNIDSDVRKSSVVDAANLS